MRDVSIIGLGTMGTALARTLLDGGYRVTVWNRTAARAAPLVADGATLAETSAEAIFASATTIVCIGTHSDTSRIADSISDLSGRTILELSTGSSSEASKLEASIKSKGGECLVGMILTYPRGIGNETSAIITAGSEAAWTRCKSIISTLAGASDYVGDQVSSLAALFAALFLPRQGFMFGMIYGALLCEKAGIPVETYAKQLPQALKVSGDYMEVVAETIPDDDYANPGASVNTYKAAFRDALDSFNDLNTDAEWPELMYDMVRRCADAGYGDEQLTALIKILR